MKLLREIVKEKMMTQFHTDPGAKKKIEEFLRDTTNTEGMHEIAELARANQGLNRIKERLANDPALRELIGPFIDVLFSIASFQLPPSALSSVMERTLANIVIIWEDANEEFNKQIASKE